MLDGTVNRHDLYYGLCYGFVGRDLARIFDRLKVILNFNGGSLGRSYRGAGW